jgi:prolyl 4-hydroxylase
MNRIDLKDKNNFIGCWNIDNNDLCEKIINFFEKNKSLQKKGTTVSGINEKVKKSIDISIDPKNLNNPEFDDIKNYFNELFKCYQDYKIQWPFLDKTLDVVDIPKFNIQKYDIGGHFSSVHCERDSKQNMHRIFAWMTYLNDVDQGGETCFEHFDLKVKPITGQTLIWPAEWTHAHKGEVLLKGNKYIITGWMHFPFNFQVPQKV